ICQKLAREGKNCLCRIRRRINRNDRRAVKAGLFYVRRHTCADGSFEWYVLNGHTRRPASKLFRTRAAAAAERARVQAELDLAKGLAGRDGPSPVVATPQSDQQAHCLSGPAGGWLHSTRHLSELTGL